jgi:hypothetical protein
MAEDTESSMPTPATIEMPSLLPDQIHYIEERETANTDLDDSCPHCGKTYAEHIIGEPNLCSSRSIK